MNDRTPDPGSPTEQVDWDALARYLAGESSPVEADAMRRWLDARSDRAELVAALDRSLARVAYQAPSDLDVESALRRVRSRMLEPDVRPLPHRAPALPRTFAPQRTPWIRGGLRAPAVLAAVAVGPTIL